MGFGLPATYQMGWHEPQGTRSTCILWTGTEGGNSESICIMHGLGSATKPHGCRDAAMLAALPANCVSVPKEERGEE
jgi:hypothetical protein